jgi:ribosome biogenesis GTPase
VLTSRIQVPATRIIDAMLSAYGWDDHWSALFSPLADGDNQPGRIVRHDRAAPLVVTETGLAHLPVRRNVGPLTVGDWVVVEGGEVIIDRLERSSLLRRRDPGADEQLLAANIDVVAMVFGADRPLKAGRLFRTQTQIWDAGAVPLVVLTKTDLIENDDGGVEALIERVHAIDPLLDVVPVSCVTGAGLDDLRSHVHGRTLALIGESGAGKSTLVNALVGGDVAAVSAVRATDRRGRHTTSSRELHLLPGGGVLVDTPGLREVGLWTDESSVDAVFPEIDEHAAACHYRDCTHGSEPGCAVRAAVASGEVSPERFAAWESLRHEAAAAALRADEHNRRAADRRFGRAVKNYKRFKNEG